MLPTLTDLFAAGVVAAALSANTFAQETSRPLPPTQHGKQEDVSTPLRHRLPAQLATGMEVRGAIPRGQVLFDDAGSTIWAAADTYKAGFEAGRMTFVPFFGSQVDRNYPLTLALAELNAANPVTRVTPSRRGNVVRYEHGAVSEVYRLSADHLEQTFEVATWTGDLSIVLDLETDLRVETTVDGLRLASPHGHVAFANAVLVDADGARHAMRTEYDKGRIRLHAAAEQLAAVRFPVVVDPVISVFTVATSGVYNLANPDVAFGVDDAQYVIVYERRFSAVDYDVFSVAVDAAGNLVSGSGAWIDSSTDSWQSPRVAYNRVANRFLVVAARTPVGGAVSEIWSRTRNGGSVTLGTARQVSAGGGTKVSPDVGGDFYLAPPTYFAVVWQLVPNPADNDIQYRMVDGDGTPLAGIQAIDNSSALDLRPRIAKSDGAGPSGQQVWTVVWHRDVGAHNDIYGARLRWDGLLSTPAFAIDVSLDDDRYASVSSLTDGSTRHWLVAYQTDAHTDLDIYVRVYRDGPTPVQVAAGFLGTIENLAPPDRMRHQLTPQVDSDGCRFTIGYLEEFGLTDWDVWATTVHLGGGSMLYATDARVALDTSSLFSGSVSLVSQHSGGGSVGHHAAVWNADSTAGPLASTIRGATYDGVRPGGYSTRSTACAGLTLTHDGTLPALGATLTFSVGGTSAPRFIILSVPAPAVTLCAQGCKVGIDPNVIVPFSVSVLNVMIPCDYVLLGGALAFQGGAVGVAGGCPGFSNLALTDTIDVVVQ